MYYRRRFCQTWGSELATDYHERTRIAGFRETGAFVGYLCATLVPIGYWVGIKGLPFASYGQIVQAAGVFFMIALPVFIAWCFAAVPATTAASAHAPRWSELFAILRRNKPFARLLSCYFVDRLAMGTYFAVQPALISQALNLGNAILWVALANTIAAVLFAPAWVPIARRIGKHRAYCVANTVTLCAYASLFFIPSGALVVVLLANALMAAGNGGTMILPPAMTADAVDSDELQSGAQQTGGHMAFLAFVFKAGMGLGAFVGLGFLSQFGYRDIAQSLSSSAAFGVRFGAAWLPALLLLVPIIGMWRYPIDDARHRDIRRQLDARPRSQS